MFGMSFGELIVIGVVALIVFGPERLPIIASKAGRLAADLRRTSDAFKREFYNAVYTPADEIRTIEKDLGRLVTAEHKRTCETKRDEPPADPSAKE